MNGPGTSVRCPKCGARGAETCTTRDGRDHLARTGAEDERREYDERQRVIAAAIRAGDRPGRDDSRDYRTPTEAGPR